MKDLNIFNYNYLCTAYADDKFVLNSQKLIKELMKSFRLFSKFSGLKRNILKSEDAGIGPLKGIKMAVCGIKFNLNCTFFIKSKVTNTKRFCENITNNLWRMRNITENILKEMIRNIR